MKTKLKGNQCAECKKTHEVCGSSDCAKADISAYVCRIFGIPLKRRRG
jgi:hypothetical protein